MSNDVEQNTSRKHPEHMREIVVGIILPSAALAATLAIWAHGVFMDISDHILDCTERVAANTAHRISHEREAQQWIDRIKRNEQSVREIQRAIGELRSVPAARPDPFTDTQGRELEQRFRLLEGRE